LALAQAVALPLEARAVLAAAVEVLAVALAGLPQAGRDSMAAPVAGAAAAVVVVLALLAEAQAATHRVMAEAASPLRSAGPQSFTAAAAAAHRLPKAQAGLAVAGLALLTMTPEPTAKCQKAPAAAAGPARKWAGTADRAL
jgi:hypothetical protein